MKVWLGAGKVARELAEAEDIVVPHSKIDITNPDSVFELLCELPRNAVVVNAAAKIDLEWCEENPGAAYLVNSMAAMHVGRSCQVLGLHLVHISSGCVFDGDESNRVFFEHSIPNPACVYTKTKAEADLRLLNLGLEKLTIVRPRQLFSHRPNVKNLITKFAQLGGGRFIQNPQSATWIEDLGRMIDALVGARAYGVYNCVQAGSMSPFEMATMIRDHLVPDLVVEPTTYAEYLSTVKVRRVNTLLSTARLEDVTGYEPDDLRERFRDCLLRYGKTEAAWAPSRV